MIGFVEEIFRDKAKVIFEWKIRRVLWIPEKITKYCTSSCVEFLDTSWFLKIYPQGLSSLTKEWIGIGLSRSDGKKSGRFTLGVKKADGKVETIVREQEFPKNSLNFVKGEFLKRSELLAPSDEFTVLCTIRSDESISKEERTTVSPESKADKLITSIRREEQGAQGNPRGASTLRMYLKDLLFSGDDHDTTLKVKDKEFRVRKSILQARSPIFAAMFRHEMEEKMNNVISIEDCDPEAFSEFLLYIYTGKIEALSPSNALDLYYAGEKYDEELKGFGIEFLRCSLSKTNVCDIIALAEKHGEDVLLECATNFFIRYTNEIFTTSEWRRFVKDYPDKANELYIKAWCTKFDLRSKI